MKHFFLTLLWSALSAATFAIAVFADPEARALLHA